MSKQYTAMGKQVDMAALAAKNEKVRAVGNMNVNARGDILSPNNEVIDNTNNRINRIYNKTVDRRAMATDITPNSQELSAMKAEQKAQSLQSPPVIPVAPKPTNIDLEELTELERQFEQLEEDEDSE
jgi:hypothetical protein